VRGNERGLARIKRAKAILNEIGLDGERLDIFFMSGSQGNAFAQAAQIMTERIRRLGPNPLKQKLNGGLITRPEGVDEMEEDAHFRGRRSKSEPPIT
jgi:hypothetical protein